MAQLIVRTATQGTPLVIELRPGLNRFGRAPASDHFFDDPAISEEHCEIDVGDDGVMVRDLGSTNGTFVDRERIQHAALCSGQTLQIGPLEMVLDTRAVQVAIPDLPKADNPFFTPVEFLDDGFAACLGHSNRHAVWECTQCSRPYCDECVRKLRRVGGIYLRLCPSCNNPCKLTPWSESIKRRKKNILMALADKVASTFKHTTQRLRQAVPRKKSAGKK